MPPELGEDAERHLREAEDRTSRLRCGSRRPARARGRRRGSSRGLRRAWGWGASRRARRPLPSPGSRNMSRSGSRSENSVMSAPAENALPSPASTSARQSRPACSSSVESARSTSVEIAFSFSGRLSLGCAPPRGRPRDSSPCDASCSLSLRRSGSASRYSRRGRVAWQLLAVEARRNVVDGLATSTALCARHEGGATTGARGLGGRLRVRRAHGTSSSARPTRSGGWGRTTPATPLSLRVDAPQGAPLRPRARTPAIRGDARRIPQRRSHGAPARARDELAYGVYTRDSSVMTPFGAIVCQLANPRRRGEYVTTLRFYLANEIPIYDLVSAGKFRGWRLRDARAWLRADRAHGRAKRGDRGEAGRRLAGRPRGSRSMYAPIDEYYVHLDVLVCMLGEKLARGLSSTRSSRRSSTGSARDGSRSSRSVSATRWLSAATSWRSGTTGCSPWRSPPELNERLRALGFTVYDPDMSQFTLAGGGVHCLAQPLRRDRA